MLDTEEPQCEDDSLLLRGNVGKGMSSNYAPTLDDSILLLCLLTAKPITIINIDFLQGASSQMQKPRRSGQERGHHVMHHALQIFLRLHLHFRLSLRLMAHLLRHQELEV